MELLWLALGIGLPHYTDEHFEPEIEYRVSVGYGSGYAWGGYEKPGFSIVGQTLGDMTLIGYGAGYRYEGERWVLFAEAGWYEPDLDPKARHEVVEEQLNSNHVCQPWQSWCNANGFAQFQNTSLEYGGGYGFRVGAGWRVSRRLTIEASYRGLSLQEDLRGWNDGETEWWEETNQLDASTVAIGLTYTLRRHLVK